MAHADNLRRHFPAVRTGTYLNTGSFGALPDTTVQLMRDTLQWLLEEGRRADNYKEVLQTTHQQIREQLAHLLQVRAASIVLTDSTTHGLNIVLWGLPLQAGDEVIVTDVEHEGALLPVYVQQARRGIVIRVVDGTLPPDELCAAIDRAVTPRTRLILCSHVSYATGHRLPIEQIAKVAHARHVLVAVDGAQGMGAEPFSLAGTEIDFYAFPGHKWLCGPDGTGALYIRPDVQSMVQMTYAGSHSLAAADAYNLSGTFLASPTVQRYEHTFADLAKWAGWLESLQFLRVTVGWDYAYTRVQGLSGQLIDALLDVDHVRIATPRDRRAGLIHFQIQGMSAEQFVREAAERSLYVKAIPGRQLVRASTGFYNGDDDVERLVTLVKSSKASS
jgi:L-cysteine/cystine lyase